MSEVDAQLREAMALHERGEVAGAEARCWRVLERRPEQPEALHLLGLIAQRRGRPDRAAELIERAVERRPDKSLFRFNLGTVYLRAGRPGAAAEALSGAVDLNPGFAEAHNALGTAEWLRGRLTAAAASYRGALTLKPDFARAYNNLGTVLTAQGAQEEAEVCYRQAVTVRPGYAEAHFNLGNRLVERGRLEEAAEQYRQAVAARPEYPEALSNLGKMQRRLGRLDEAEESLRRLAGMAPRSAAAHFDLGLVLKERGDIEGAAASLRGALAVSPGYAEAHRALSHTVRRRSRDAEMAAMERLLQRPDIDDQDRMHLNFGLGKANEDLGEHDRAFEHYLAANRVKRAAVDYDIEAEAHRFEQVIAMFGEAFFAGRGDYGVADATPIFIVGMPRSGSTLTEQILASHPQVGGTGEIDDLARCLFGNGTGLELQAFPRGLDALPREAAADMAGQYIDRLRAHAPSATFVTDKMLSNFLFIGAIRLLFPRATVIHCRRDPVATCWSCFKHHFAQGQWYTYDLVELGRYYRLYQRLMAHWHAVLPSFVYDVDYEALISDQENTTRALLERCGLPWDDACLSFHETDRGVKTASSVQVRQPLYGGAVRQWEHYREHLGPLMEALQGEAGS